ncbi:MAG: hypothetical protein A2046_14000 [Bacteroidetes bacterium GWA2_30_7]|nr:MAG: hypothetical protein A2046_14000 [Bacteroidetes bacterium GWA2_30_7]
MSITNNILNEQNRKNSFKVPDNYFDDLSQKIQNKIQNSNVNHVKNNKYIFNPIFAYSLGLGLILIIMFGLYKFSNSDKKIINLDNNEISELMLNGDIEFDDEQVAEFYLSNQTGEISYLTTEQDGIYEYLNEEELDEQSIYNEYN